MRIGTWNLAGKWSDAHLRLLLSHGVDVWLLTEVSEKVAIEGYDGHVTAASMAARRRWAGVFSSNGRMDAIQPLLDPHPASAMARVGPFTFCSSILPWKGAWRGEPWLGTRHVDKTERCLRDLLESLPSEHLVWGGDWNHALTGTERAGSQAGRVHLLAALDQLGLQVPTAALPHCIDGLLSIDHVAVPVGVEVVSAQRVAATSGDKRLSDHDAYVVEVDL